MGPLNLILEVVFFLSAMHLALALPYSLGTRSCATGIGAGHAANHLHCSHSGNATHTRHPNHHANGTHRDPTGTTLEYVAASSASITPHYPLKNSTNSHCACKHHRHHHHHSDGTRHYVTATAGMHAGPYGNSSISALVSARPGTAYLTTISTFTSSTTKAADVATPATPTALYLATIDTSTTAFASSSTPFSASSPISSSTPSMTSSTTTSNTLSASVSAMLSISSSALPPPAHSVSPSTSTAKTPFLRGVNIGSWLILEQWMVPNIFSGSAASAVDQWTYDQTPNAASNLQQHWSTWFTQADVQTLASYGINALRIPIGYWAYDNSNTPFIQGADAYLEQAISWARAANMRVWVDMHGSPGSQNGQMHSGHQGPIEWQQDNNLNHSTTILCTIAQKYGAMAYADVVVGLEVVNEPTASGNNSFATSQQWALDAYHAIKAVVENENLVIVTHDSFMGPETFIPLAQELGGSTFGVDTHNYQLYTTADNALTQPQHIAKACSWASTLSTTKAAMPVYVGEFSALTNICVLSDGSTVAGTTCHSEGCQCSVSDPSTWNTRLVEQVRRYVEAQLDVFEGGSDGWFLWTWGGPGGWGVRGLVDAGVLPLPITSRKYPGQCG